MVQPSGRKPWYRKARWWLLIGIATLVVVIRLALNPLIVWEAHRKLAVFQTFRITFGNVSLHALRGSCTIDSVKVVKLPTPPEGASKRPYFYAPRVEVGIQWKDLIHHHEIVAGVRLIEPQINLIGGKKSSNERQLAPEEPNLTEKLSKLIPIDVERVEILRGGVAFVDSGEPSHPSVWLHKMDVSVENLASRVGLNHGEPTTLALTGMVNKSGAVSLFATTDPLSKTLAFAGRAAVRHLDLKDLDNFVTTKTGMTVKEGTIDVFVEFDAHNGQITGGVEPILRNAKLDAAQPDVGDQIKALLADTAIDLFSDRVEGQKRVATVIPIKGSVKNPQAQLWPTIFGVVRNGFVEGLNAGFSELPPPTAKKPQDLLQQAGQALDKKSRPHAQPPQGGT